MSGSPPISCLIYLRHDQRESDVEAHSNENVTIYAPTWVSEGLAVLGQRLRGTSFNIVANNDPTKVIQSFTVENDTLTLKDLQKISRNEKLNVSGHINWQLYAELQNHTELLLAMKDLVRQCIIVGKDFTTHYGGYGASRHPQPNVPVYICDLAGLQFQTNYNTGRLVLIPSDEPSIAKKGLLDDLIFEKVVGEKKQSYEEAKASGNTERFIETGYFSMWTHKCFTDVKAYRTFVAADVYLCGCGLIDTLIKSQSEDKINFKFLKYGTGFFAGRYSQILSNHILEGVIEGLEKLFSQTRAKEFIRQVEFPFYKETPENKKRLKELKKKYHVEYRFSNKDALQDTTKGLITATTNCADTMAVFGNEMGFSSVDAAIASNLTSSGNIFCPILNPAMKEEFIEV